MYIKRIQIINYGPIDQLDITFPFEGDTPKPVILVGENGSGKSILLSHIVNGLVSAKDIVYPETPEVDVNKVYKLRSSSYIKSGSEFYFARVDFENDLFMGEIRSKLAKERDSNPPVGLSGKNVQDAWREMQLKTQDHLTSNISLESETKIKEIFSKNCILYFPPNRFEEPAWLNEENLRARAEYMDLKHTTGYTNRRIISYSPLHDNQHWLFEVIYDSAAFEAAAQVRNIPVKDSKVPLVLPFLHYSGQATSIYEIALQIVRSIIKEGPNIRFGIGKRQNRVVSIVDESRQLVPNIFQLSSGETSLLNLFLSILRDFDLSNSSLTKAEDIRGIVVVDEIDLHLHVAHQYTILPQLIKMFPNVQFVVTTHSPLFVLGMKHLYGEDGFALLSIAPWTANQP